MVVGEEFDDEPEMVEVLLWCLCRGPSCKKVVEVLNVGSSSVFVR